MAAAKKSAKKTTAKKTAAKKTVAKKTVAKKTVAKKTTTNKASAKKSAPKKDPAGGLTAAGRAYFKKTEGANLRPGVTGKADTPEKKKRKGSFLRRHFANPQGPMKDDAGEPTRLALSAHAWGEPVPTSKGDAKKLADKGSDLLEQFHESTDDKPKKPAAKKTSRKKK